MGVKKYTLNDLAQLIDHTNLRADASPADMRRLCDEAQSNHFKMVAVNSTQVRVCSTILAGSDVGIGAAISFPLGQTTIDTKVFETSDAIRNGATEIDYMINLTEVKAKNWTYVKNEMKRIVTICRNAITEAGIPVASKVIFENCLLEDAEKIELCKIACEIQPTFVKTSTGFSTGGATLWEVRLMRQHCNPSVRVKAAGGIRDAKTFLAMIHAGAARIGCSGGVHIMIELKSLFQRKNIDQIDL